uniref:Uncharacterized protein n=1 Tax=Rhizophora mucronata TaxID=61149 RepID=A0A2P2JBN6_RHIMU
MMCTSFYPCASRAPYSVCGIEIIPIFFKVLFHCLAIS